MLGIWPAPEPPTQPMLLADLLGTLVVLFSFLLPFATPVKARGIRLQGRASGGLDPQWMELSVDHSRVYNGTFKNRYWYNATYYQSGGPVFLQDVGEADGDNFTYLLSEQSNIHTGVMRLAKRYKGVAVLWEHRYYGQSLPFNITTNDSLDHWKYHTVDQALEDVVHFADSFTIPGNGTGVYRFTPSVTPWVFIGGSYSGARAAFIRIRNPETIYASWSSSGPVQAQIDMSSFWKAAQRSLPRNCSNDWVAVTSYVDNIMANGSATDVFNLKYNLTKAKFTRPGGNVSQLPSVLSAQNINSITSATAASYLMDPLGDFQRFGVEPIIPFCDVLETQNFTSPAYTQGLYHQFGPNVTLSAFLVGLSETEPDQVVVAGPPSSDVDNLSWAYQYCSQFGFFQGAGLNNTNSIQTTFRSLQSIQDNCLGLFPGLASPPNVSSINIPYKGWNMNPTHVFFTNGEFDPWRTLSIASFEPNAPGRIGSSAIPRCKTAPDPSTYFGVVYRGQEHIPDLTSKIGEPNPYFYTSLSLFQMALDEWLPCFGQ